MKFKDLKPGAIFWIVGRHTERFLKIKPVEDKYGNNFNTCTWSGEVEESEENAEVVELRIGRLENTKDLEALQREIKRLTGVAGALEKSK